MNMSPWAETIGVTLLAGAGGGIGYAFSRLRKRYWIPAFAVSFLLFVIVNVPWLTTFPPGCWLAAGRTEEVIAAFVLTMLLFTVLPQLSSKRKKVLVAALAVAAELHLSLISFLHPALLQNYHLGLTTEVTGSGVCLQSTGYTCAPAAAVTALRLLDLEAGEGELSVLARTRPVQGTSFGLLRSALNKRYRDQGLKCTEEPCDTIEQLRGPGVAIVSIKLESGIGHAITVMEVTDDEVIVGDPRSGLQRMSYEEFMGVWNRGALVLTREPPGEQPTPP